MHQQQQQQRHLQQLKQHQLQQDHVAIAPAPPAASRPATGVESRCLEPSSSNDEDLDRCCRRWNGDSGRGVNAAGGQAECISLGVSDVAGLGVPGQSAASFRAHQAIALYGTLRRAGGGHIGVPAHTVVSDTPPVAGVAQQRLGGAFDALRPIGAPAGGGSLSRHHYLAPAGSLLTPSSSALTLQNRLLLRTHSPPPTLMSSVAATALPPPVVAMCGGGTDEGFPPAGSPPYYYHQPQQHHYQRMVGGPYLSMGNTPTLNRLLSATAGPVTAGGGNRERNGGSVSGDWCPSKHTPIRTQPVVPTPSSVMHAQPPPPPPAPTVPGASSVSLGATLYHQFHQNQDLRQTQQQSYAHHSGAPSLQQQKQQPQQHLQQLPFSHLQQMQPQPSQQDLPLQQQQKHTGDGGALAGATLPQVSSAPSVTGSNTTISPTTVSGIARNVAASSSVEANTPSPSLAADHRQQRAAQPASLTGATSTQHQHDQLQVILNRGGRAPSSNDSSMFSTAGEQSSPQVSCGLPTTSTTPPVATGSTSDNNKAELSATPAITTAAPSSCGSCCSSSSSSNGSGRSSHGGICANGGKFLRGDQVCCVFLLNRSCLALQVESLATVTAGQILQQVADAPCSGPGLGQDVCLAFALWIANADLELQLEPGRAPLDVYRAWSSLITTYCTLPAPLVGEPKLILQRNVTLGEDEERAICQRNSAVLELLYHEARCNVLDGRYPVTEHVALRLAAFQAAIELEGQSASDIIADKAGHFLPARHIRRGRSLLLFGQNIEKKLVQEYRDLLMCRSTDKASLMRDYLDVCRKLVFYGSAFFPGSLDAFFGSRRVTVAINRRGLHILSKGGRLEASYLFSANQYPPLFSWDYGRPVQNGLEPCLYVTDGYQSSHQIFSKQAFLMDKMLLVLQPSKL